MTNMFTVSVPLRKRTEKDAEWKWTETEKRNCNELKKLATEAPVLRFYDPQSALALPVGASSTESGCVIMLRGQPTHVQFTHQNAAKLLTDREHQAGMRFHLSVLV